LFIARMNVLSTVDSQIYLYRFISEIITPCEMQRISNIFRRLRFPKMLHIGVNANLRYFVYILLRVSTFVH